MDHCDSPVLFFLLFGPKEPSPLVHKKTVLEIGEQNDIIIQAKVPYKERCNE